MDQSVVIITWASRGAPLTKRRCWETLYDWDAHVAELYDQLITDTADVGRL